MQKLNTAVQHILRNAARDMLEFDLPEQAGDTQAFARYVGCAFEVFNWDGLSERFQTEVKAQLWFLGFVW